MTWTLFATIFSQIGPPLQSTSDTITSGLVTWVKPALQWGIIIYITARMIAKALSHDGEPISEMETIAIKASIALYIATNITVYDGYVRDFLENGLYQEISAVITGANASTPVSAASFDDSWNKAYVAGLTVYKNLGSWFNPQAIGLAFVIVLYWLVALLCIGIAFAVWLKAFVMIVLLVSVGPLFAGVFVFPAMLGMFERWLGSILSNVLLQIFTTVLLSLLLMTESKIIGSIASVGNNEFLQIQMLMGGMILFVVCAWLVHELPALASTIANGVAVNGSSASRAAYAAIMGVFFGMRAAQASNGGAGQSGSGQPSVQNSVRNAPPIRSLSDA